MNNDMISITRPQHKFNYVTENAQVSPASIQYTHVYSLSPWYRQLKALMNELKKTYH